MENLDNTPNENDGQTSSGGATVEVFITNHFCRGRADTFETREKAKPFSEKSTTKRHRKLLKVNIALVSYVSVFLIVFGVLYLLFSFALKPFCLPYPGLSALLA